MLDWTGPFVKGLINHTNNSVYTVKRVDEVSSSTPASGDAGPNDTGVEQIFPHPCQTYCLQMELQSATLPLRHAFNYYQGINIILYYIYIYIYIYYNI